MPILFTFHQYKQFLVIRASNLLKDELMPFVYSTGKQLMFFIGEMVPKLKSRQSKSAAGEGSGSSQSASGGASKKKKGKKK